MENNENIKSHHWVDEDQNSKQYGAFLEVDTGAHTSTGIPASESLLSLSSGSSNELFSLTKFNEEIKSKNKQEIKWKNKQEIKSKYGDFARLLIASLLSLSFLFVELVGAYYSSSLALYYMTAHTTCDVIGFLTYMSSSLITSGKRGTDNAIRREELLGFLCSCLLTWCFAGALLLASFQRMKGYGFYVMGEVMISVAILGFLNSLLNGIIFHGCEEECGGPYGGVRANRLLLSTTKLHTIADVITSGCIVVVAVLMQVNFKWKAADAIVTICAVIGSLIITLISMKDSFKLIYKDEKQILLKQTTPLLRRNP